MTFIPKPQEIYKHFKGNLYQVQTIAEHSETGELLVIYQALYGEYKVYARELSMFTGPVDRQKYPQAEQYFRFELQGRDSARAAEREVERTPERSVTSPVDDKQETEAEKPTATEIPEEASESAKTAKADENPGIDPAVWEFLDADTYSKRIRILTGLHHRITDDMITTMAIACDVEISDGDVEQRFEALKSCLITREHYECQRVR